MFIKKLQNRKTVQGERGRERGEETEGRNEAKRKRPLGRARFVHDKLA